jgi:hypothetical protein
MPKYNNLKDICKRYVVDENKCWNWSMSRSQSGYGKVYYSGKDFRAHRISFFYYNGYMPKMVLHKCDNRLCINPEHLYAGNHLSNMKDMKVKGRAFKPKGSAHPMSKLKEKDVANIRLLFNSGNDLKFIAKEYRLHLESVRQIINRKRWKHI